MLLSSTKSYLPNPEVEDSGKNVESTALTNDRKLLLVPSMLHHAGEPKSHDLPADVNAIARLQQHGFSAHPPLVPVSQLLQLPHLKAQRFGFDFSDDNDFHRLPIGGCFLRDLEYT